MHTNPKELVDITVELFGQAQLVANQKEIKIKTPKISDINIVSKILANHCEHLIGPVVKQNGLGLQSSYIANLNGEKFLAEDCFEIHSGDRILIFSSQAGG